MKLQYVGSYTSMFGHLCYKWTVIDGAGPLVHKPFALSDREVLFPGDIVQCIAARFWDGTAVFKKGYTLTVDKQAVRHG